MSRKWRRRPHLVFGLLVAGFVAAITVWLRGLEWGWVAAYLVAINGVTFSAYGYDKVAAGSFGPRVPERVLHGAAFAGGTPAALLAMKLLRHKTAKSSFQIAFWVVAIVQLAIAVWLVGRELGR